MSSRGRTSDENEDGDGLDADIGVRVKAILLDDSGFWTPLAQSLHVAMPIIKLLRNA